MRRQEEEENKGLACRRRNCARAQETMDVSEPELSCCFGSLTNSSDANYPSLRRLQNQYHSSSVRQSRTNVGGHEVTQAADFFFILWNMYSGSLKSYVYYTHSSYSHSFSTAFPILLQLSKALMIVRCNTKRFPLQ